VKALAVVALAAALLAPPARASERHPTLNELEGQVMCPTCHTTLDQSSSPAAERIKLFIRNRIAAGDSRSQIKRRLVAEFGSAILAEPPKHGFDLLAWVLPLAGIIGAAAVLAVAAARWTRSRPAAAAPAGARLDPVLERRLDEALERFDE
jgi:cytochrome c-type biogenesis protein CcmH